MDGLRRYYIETRATNDAADQVCSHSPKLSAQFAWQGLMGLPGGMDAYFTGGNACPSTVASEEAQVAFP